MLIGSDAFWWVSWVLSRIMSFALINRHCLMGPASITSRSHIFLTGSVAPSTQPDKLMKSTTHTIDPCPSRAALPSNTDLLLKCRWVRSTSWFLKARKCSGARLPQPECLMCCHLGLGCPRIHHHDCECTQHSLC